MSGYHSIGEIMDQQAARQKAMQPHNHTASMLEAALAKIVTANQQLAQQREHLARQRAQRDITEDEHYVFSKRAAQTAKAEAWAGADEARAFLTSLMDRPEAHGGDAYAASYWDPKTLDHAAIQRHSEMIARQLTRVSSPEAARAILDEAAQDSKEATYAAWLVGPAALKTHHNLSVKAIGGRAENLLRDRLQADPGFQSAAAIQHEILAAVDRGVATLHNLAKSESGGLNTIKTGVLPAPQDPGTVAGVAEQFVRANGTVTFNCGPGGAFRGVQPPPMVVRPVSLPATVAAETGGVF